MLNINIERLCEDKTPLDHTTFSGLDISDDLDADVEQQSKPLSEYLKEEKARTPFLRGGHDGQNQNLVVLRPGRLSGGRRGGRLMPRPVRPVIEQLGC